MAEDTNTVVETSGETVVVRERRPLWQSVAKWIAIVLLGLVLVLIAAVFAIDTQPGRRFLVDRINAFTTASGINVRVGRIEGSVYGAMVLRDVQLRDPKGVFASSPRIAVDWRPFAYVNNHVDVRSVTSPLVRYLRNPELLATPPSDPEAPLLPDLDIDIGRLAVDRIEVAPAVTGQRHVARFAGRVKIADRRAQIVANAAAVAAPGVAGGDRLSLRLDAVPDDNRFDVDLRVAAPANGFVAGLAGLEAPLTLNVDGRGSWADWRGRLAGRLGGADLADLAITGRNGAFQVRGYARPGLYLEGPVERLTAPRMQIALDTTMDERRMDTRLRLRSDALAVATQGVIDLGQSRFGDFRAEAMLLTPGAIAPALRGNAVRAAIVLDGPFRTPTVDYKVQAAAIGFGETVVEQLYAEGLATVDSERILIPIKARARRIGGLNAAVGGLVTNVSIVGDLAITGSQILSDNLRLRSDRIDATAIIAANMATGRYTGALKGRVNDYEVASIGILNLSTDASLYAAPQGGFGIRGRVVAQTTRLFNDGIRNFLGGNLTTRVDVGVDPDGIITFSNLRLNAPQFRITNGSGRYDPAGPLLVNADAYSNQYGPLSARVTGSVAAPVILVRAPRPGVGVGLANLQATIRGQGDRYAIVASGSTNYGPFSADVLLGTSPRLSADIRRARFAGMDIDGRVEATPAEPFAGRINFAGSGVAGIARLGAEGRFQRADFNARAYNARIPGTAELTIGRAIVTGSAVLYDDAPAIVADAQLANFRSGELVVTRGRARVNYRGGRGSAQLFGEGSSGVPFRIAANAQLSPDQYLVALQGRGNNIGFRTVNPARIAVERGGYRLFPTRIDFDQGSARIAGTYGNGMSIQSRIDRLDLGIVNAFVPNTGIAGTATGSLDFAQASGASFPRADAKLTIRNFRRSSLTSVSDPVDIVFAGDLRPEGGSGRALIRRGTTTVGRMVANLNPLPPGAGAWTTRLLAAPLSGGIRYNGPSGVLFSFAGLSDQQLSGPIGIAADFGGRVQAPRLNGVVRASNLTYENEALGTRLTNMRIDGRFTNDRFELATLTARAGEGTVSAQGSVGLASDSGFPIDVRATLRDAQLARSDALGASATGDIRIVNGPGGGTITGDLTIPEARYQIIRQGSAEVPELTGVRRRGDVVRAQADGPARPGAAPPPGLFRLDLRVRADNRIYVSGMGLESEWETDLRVRGTSAAPRVEGVLRVIRGTYSFAGKRFDLSRGIVRFEGQELTNPGIDIAASTTAEGITANIVIAGTAQAPRITFTSTPALAQDEVLSRLLFGSSVTNLSATEAIQLAAALNSLRGSGGGGLNPLGKLRSATGIDRLRILGSDEASGRGTALAAGQYLTDDIYIEIITDARGFTATQLEIALSRTLSLLSQTGSFGGSNATFRYSRDY